MRGSFWKMHEYGWQGNFYYLASSLPAPYPFTELLGQYPIAILGCRRDTICTCVHEMEYEATWVYNSNLRFGRNRSGFDGYPGMVSSKLQRSNLLELVHSFKNPAQVDLDRTEPKLLGRLQVFPDIIEK